MFLIVWTSFTNANLLLKIRVLKALKVAACLLVTFVASVTYEERWH